MPCSCSEVLRVLRALDFEIPDDNEKTANFLMAQIDKNQDGSVNTSELEAALGEESFYQVRRANILIVQINAVW